MQSLPVAGGLALDAADVEWRELYLLLLWLLDRLPGQARPRGGIRSRLAVDPARRGRLSLDEHHVVQHAGLYRRLHRWRCQSTACDPHAALDLCDAGNADPRRAVHSRDLPRGLSRSPDILGADRRWYRRCLRLFRPRGFRELEPCL